jgi:cleavage and polyadenylation specificity factor subunit 1
MTDAKVATARFIEPYVLLLRDDSSIMVLRADDSGDLEEIERGEILSTTKWLSGSLFDDTDDVFRLDSEDEDEDETGTVLMFLLSSVGGLQVSSPQ